MLFHLKSENLLMIKYYVISIYFAIFEPNLNYCSLVWDQNYNAINPLVILLEKALRFMNFSLEILIPVLYLEKLLS